MIKSIVIISMGLMMMLFQNCQQASFAGGVDSSSKSQGALTPLVAEDPDDLKNPDVITDPDVNPEDTSSDNPPAPPPVVTQVPDSSATGNYVCILGGPGKSVKLGMSSEGRLRGQNKIPKVVCMTREACLDIASRVFVVKGPELRGYCKSGGNPHVTHLSNGAIDLKVRDLE